MAAAFKNKIMYRIDSNVNCLKLIIYKLLQQNIDIFYAYPIKHKATYISCIYVEICKYWQMEHKII